MKRNRFPSFGGLKSFYALALDGTAVRAAERLSVSSSSISHQVKNLEQELGVRLIENRKGKLHLTSDGEQYFEAIRGPLAEILRATEEVRLAPGRRGVTLTLTPSFASGWLMPLLQDLYKAHPDIELNLVTTTRVIDLEREKVDLAIRRGDGDWPDCTSRQLLKEITTPVIAPKLWDTLKAKTLAHAFAKTRLLVNTTVPDEWDEWCDAQGVDYPPANQRFNLETYELTVQAAKDGLGITLGRKPLIDTLLQTGELVEPWKSAYLDNKSYFVLYTEGELNTYARRVFDWLIEHKS